MRIKRKDANVVKICEASQVKVKTAGDTTVIQFCAGQNKKEALRQQQRKEKRNII